ncbi:LacI family DNA-binding transcriptional regulator [Streptomyces sp. PSKA54]|uniref:LacI family DNA-binding transcriptional regulator n=1 Tax=Streptomyces himalayensis subsp. aureolus TaxID=2758039 RepID=A0A7W2D7Q4_9ACTN|nr:LacI family DNA-binding transcriptional regulator [Streptomyces himalayensis subsp. aureolus]
MTEEQRSSHRRPTISDVATRAGVSKGAVSRTFNGGKGISPGTMARIRAAAAELNWTPSTAARAVSGGPAHAVGLVLRRPAELLELDPFFPAFLAGVESALTSVGYAAVLRFVGDSHTEREGYEQLVGERRVDGFLLTDLRHRDPRFELLSRLGARAVVAGSPGRTCPFPWVSTGSAGQVRELIRHLIAQGHRTIAHVAGTPSLRHARRRRQLWQDTVIEAGLEPGPVVTGDFTTDGGARATRELLDQSPRPTAIFYANDLMAIAGLSVLAEHGVKVPDDMAVAGFDDISLASYVTPALTTVRCDYRRMGQIATHTLLAQLRNEEVAPQFTIGGELRLRRSTGA